MKFRTPTASSAGFADASASRLLATTVLSLSLATSVMVWAAGGARAAGGNGGNGAVNTAAGAGGTTDLTTGAATNGGDGTTGVVLGGGAGGGGAGTSGGNGGTGGASGDPQPGGTPGTGGTAAVGGVGGAGGNGGAGAGPIFGSGGGGGGGGAHGATTATLPGGALTGGAGGNGGAAGNGGGGGGGGGAGGFGAFITGSGGTNAAAILGGAGGTGGLGGNGPVNPVGGSGGDGGAGVFFAIGTTGTLTNNSTITGGAGGVAGAAGSGAGSAGAAGAGGAGVVGSNMTINNAGTITGGLGGNGVRANAISFTGGIGNGLNFGNGTSGLIGNIDIASGGIVTINAAAGGTTVGNTITGAGGIIANGAGSLILTVANTYSGGTGIASALQIDNAGALGSGFALLAGGTLRANVTGTVANNLTVFDGSFGRVVANNGLTATMSGTVEFRAGATALQFGEAANTGVVILSNNAAPTIAGAPAFNIDVLGGTLRGTGSVLGSLTAAAVATNVAAGATLDFAAGSSTVKNLQSAGTVNIATGTLTVGAGQATGAITGGGGLTVDATGTSFALTAANTYTGGTTVTNGRLDIAGTGSVTSNVTNNAPSINTATFNNAGTVTGSVVNNAVASSTGTITGGVTNAGTFVAAGTINGNISNLGAGIFGVLGNLSNNGGSFTNGNGTPLLAVTGGNFTGIGTLTNSALGIGTGVVVGAGRTLGATSIVNSSTLVNNGTVASNLTNTGGVVGGTGTFVGTSTFTGGTLSPGNSIGTITFQGNLSLSAAATYLIEIDPTTSDRTNVTGTATLGGATVSAMYAAGSYVAKRYTILNAAGGVSGTFGSVVNTNLPAGFRTSLAYDATNAYLDLALSLAPPTGPNFGAGLSGNQQNVGNALINSFNAASGIPLVFGTLTPAGLTQVAGEAATGAQQSTFQAMDQFVGTMTDPFMGTRSGGIPGAGASGYADEAMSYAAKRKGRTPAERDAYAAVRPAAAAPVERRWSLWGAGYGGTQTTDGSANIGSNSFTSRVGGGAAGLDYQLDPHTLVGFSLGGAGTTYSLANGLGRGRSEIFQAGIYGRHVIGPAYIAGALAYGWQDVTTDRVALLNSYRANFDASSLTGRLEAGWRYAIGTSGIAPYAAGQFTTFWLPGYAEQTIAGVNTFALAYSEKDVTASRSELGLRGDTSFAMQDAIVTLRGRAAWAHNFDTTRDVTAIFQTLPASSFVVNGAAQAHDSALVSASAETRWLNGFSVAASFEGEFSNVTDSYAGKGILRYQW